jgi:hypothetical protein
VFAPKVDCGVYALGAAEAHLAALSVALARPTADASSAATTTTPTPATAAAGSSEGGFEGAPHATAEAFAAAQSAAIALLMSPFLAGRLTPAAVTAKRAELLDRALAMSP